MIHQTPPGEARDDDRKPHQKPARRGFRAGSLQIRLRVNGISKAKTNSHLSVAACNCDAIAAFNPPSRGQHVLPALAQAAPVTTAVPLRDGAAQKAGSALGSGRFSG